ncbi:histone-like nucleoid-structuring protein, MvaT/MvaU family [Pseudomonas khavaziana]|uniref:histone-like nucleoid-structuring protein, MvaT/MvaU family n=1 Tax=Pseudomonas khavaziana TaxID=2842351 RepID=UPI00384CFDB3
MATQLADLKSIKSDIGLKKEIDFETKLRALLNKYGFSLNQIISILDPESSRGTLKRTGVTPKNSSKPRIVKIYKKPDSGELIETKGSNHRQLKHGKLCMALRLSSLGGFNNAGCLARPCGHYGRA